VADKDEGSSQMTDKVVAANAAAETLRVSERSIDTNGVSSEGEDRGTGGMDRNGASHAGDSGSWVLNHVRPACAPDMPPNRRLLLLPMVPQFHGSTALEGVFMSSPHVTTLCSSNVWQCEGHFIYAARNEELHDATDILKTYSKYWDLRQPVFLDKGPRDHTKLLWERAEMVEEIRTDFPKAMTAAGITHLSMAYVLMWRPICLSWLSRQARQSIQDNITAFAADELVIVEGMAESHKYLTSMGMPVVVVNLADMMWRPNESRRRLLDFLPCLESIDLGFVPSLGVDIFPGNEWKASGSIQAFGASTDPDQCCSYDAKEQACATATNVFDLLSEEERDRANEATDYLLAYS